MIGAAAMREDGSRGGGEIVLTNLHKNRSSRFFIGQYKEAHYTNEYIFQHRIIIENNRYHSYKKRGKGQRYVWYSNQQCFVVTI